MCLLSVCLSVCLTTCPCILHVHSPLSHPPSDTIPCHHTRMCSPAQHRRSPRPHRAKAIVGAGAQGSKQRKAAMRSVQWSATCRGMCGVVLYCIELGWVGLVMWCGCVGHLDAWLSGEGRAGVGWLFRGILAGHSLGRYLCK
jgi:hypothetical protein